LKVNTCPHLIISDLKILNIHNQILLRENNKVGCLSKTQINNQISFHTWIVLGPDLRNPKRGGYSLNLLKLKKLDSSKSLNFLFSNTQT
jgi:hypothetical protein